MANELDAIIDRVVTAIGTVTDAGKARAYGFWTINPQTFLDQFKYTMTAGPEIGKIMIRGWIVTRARASQKRISMPKTKERVQVIEVHGYHSLSESIESEKLWQELVELVMDAMTAIGRDTNNPKRWYDVNMPQVDFVGHDLFGEKLCHTCTISMEFKMEKQITES